MNDTTAVPVNGETRVGSDEVTITCTVTRGRLTVWRDPDGHLHNPDGPALLSVAGEQMWCRHGVMHRDGDLPAHTDRFGVNEYRVDGLLHRDGGLPAIEGPQHGPWRRKHYYVHGIRHRDGGLPAIEGPGGREYLADGKRHRDGGLPAVEMSDGRIEFWTDGKLHNPTGPAVIKPGNGGEEFWLDGVRYPDVLAYKEAGGVPPEQPIVRAVDPEPPASRRTIRRKTA